MLDLLFNLNDRYTPYPPRKKGQRDIGYSMDMVLNTAKSNFRSLERLWVHIWLIKTLYYKMWQKYITKYIRFITKCDSFYKIRRLLQFFFFFYLGFLSQPFTNHRAAREVGGHFLNSSLPLPPASQTLRH